MNPAFWDSSSLVPLCVRQKPSPAARSLLAKYKIVVWWATSIEMRSALERLLRIGDLTAQEHAIARLRMERLRLGWRELQPNEPLRAQAETLLAKFPLKAADALQLAAALVWSSSAPRTHVFIAGDGQMLSAARQCGFQTIATS